MEKHTNVLRRFLPILERYEPIILDSSAITTYKTCSRLFFYQYVLAKVSKDSKPYIRFGSAYHKFREILSKRYKTWRIENPTLDIDSFPDGFLLEATKAALDLFTKEGGDPNPQDRHAHLTKGRLFASIKIAYEYWKDEKRKGQVIVIGVEDSINFQYANGNRKCGRVDESIEWNGKLWIRDFKCSGKDPKYYPKSLKIKDQAYTYLTGAASLSGRKVEGIIYEQMYNDKPTKTTQKGPSIHPHIIQFTPAQLKNWDYEQQLIHEQINRSRELDIYPMCENDLRCVWCDYYEVCDAMNENQMIAILNNKFKHKIWDNMNPNDE